jgi:FecR-like protein
MTTPEQVPLLWSRLLGGERLSAEDQQLLVDALNADRRLRESLLENLQIDGMLRAMSTTQRRGDAFVRTMGECMEAENDATSFVAKVELRLNESDPPSTARRSKPPTTRLFRRRPSAGRTGETAWVPASIAAGVLAAILFVMTGPTPSEPPPSGIVERPRPHADRKPEPPAPPAPPMLGTEKPRIDGGANLRLVPRQFSDQKQEDRPAPPVTPERPVPMEDRPPTRVEPKAPVDPAVVVRHDGAVYIAKSGAGRTPAKLGERVPPDHHVETSGASSSALLRFADKTWVEVGGNSSFRPLEGEGAAVGRRVSLNSGTLQSHIEKQPMDRPMVFATPNSKATVLGTTIRLSFTPDPRPTTTLEVKEGKVRLTRLSDGKFVDVAAGHFAVVGEGIDLAAHKNIPDELIIRFGPPDIASDATMWVDSGEEFDSRIGYGWVDKKRREIIAWWQNQPKHKGREAVYQTTDPKVDALKSTAVAAGWAGHAETWRMPVANGRYLITVCCGDATWEQGPHHVWVEGLQLIDCEKNKKGFFVEKSNIIEVRDGELTMRVGGYERSMVSEDGSSDTLLNYLIIRRVDPRRK